MRTEPDNEHAGGDAEVRSTPRSERVSLPRRYRMVIAYDGKNFHGWQKQHPPGSEPLRTVQGVIEQAMVGLLRQPINLLGASRTDAGVHAMGQVAQFDAATPIEPHRLVHAINSRLPDDVEIVSVAFASPRFNAITDALSKQYRYRLFNTHRRPLGQRHYVYHCTHELDVARMNDAAGRLVGRHDFAGFTAAGHGRVTTVRTIHLCRVEQTDPLVDIVIQGDGFLYNMVRIIAGTLVEVGRGRFAPEQVDRALTTGDRREAGPTLPPQGLCLEWIRYPQEADVLAGDDDRRSAAEHLSPET